MRICFLAFACLLLVAGRAAAENPAPYSGTQLIDTEIPFDAFAEKLEAAIKANKMGLVAQACATCGAKSIGMTIPGNRVLMIFRPDFAVRMLEASEAAGIEAPLRLYLTERPDGTARLTYRLPSHVFAPYEVPALNEMTAELDEILARIVQTAAQG